MILEAIKKRRAVRNYKPDALSDKIIKELIIAADFAPSAMGSHALEFIVVKDKEMKAEIFNIVGQEFIKDAPVLIVPVADTKKAKLPDLDIAVASENLMIQATEFGLASIWKHVRPEWQQGVKDLLGMPSDFYVTNIIPVGFAQTPEVPHSENEFDIQKIHTEKW
jgi:nitroreductase